ncbi:hypothetical protein SESBI_05749 [Sesbania bispinosa]|nr:hypothetical protein SESBI_05749 [Sesbania bispinosa]
MQNTPNAVPWTSFNTPQNSHRNATGLRPCLLVATRDQKPCRIAARRSRYERRSPSSFGLCCARREMGVTVTLLGLHSRLSFL